MNMKACDPSVAKVSGCLWQVCWLLIFSVRKEAGVLCRVVCSAFPGKGSTIRVGSSLMVLSGAWPGGWDDARK